MTTFGPCFLPERVAVIEPLVDEAGSLLRSMFKIEPIHFIGCMSEAEITEGAKVGAGHGIYIPPGTVNVNPGMDDIGVVLNWVHENIHNAAPQATENLVDHLTEMVAYQMGLRR